MSVSSSSEAIQQAVNLLRKAHHAVAFTGAGISTPSGIPDFRTAGIGLWQKSDPMKVASLTSYRRTPQVFYDWLRPLARQISLAKPNAAHQALARLEESGILKAVITQNIDGLHQQAGSHTVLELHGTMTTLICSYCHQTFNSEAFLGPFIEDGTIPKCLNCGRNLKPDIVLYEEMLPMKTWRDAQDHSEKADVFLIAGSSLEVMPAAGLPVYALENNADLIIINFTPTFLDDRAEVLLPLDVAEVLPQIAQLLI